MNYLVDFSDCIKIDMDFGEYKDFRIVIKGFYEWGVGYVNSTMQSQFNKFINFLSDNISNIFTEKHISKLIFIEKSDISCCEIIARNPEIEPTYVYLHPMEFTGIAKEKDIEKLCECINKYCNVNNIEDCNAIIDRLEDTYHLTDETYTDIIFNNSKAIIKKVQEYVNTLNSTSKQSFLERGYKEMGFDFAKSVRIKRDFSHNTCYSSSDIDIVAVNNIIKLAIDNDLIK